MSRCYPYPRPGYVKNGIRDEALIESIKIQREEEKAKKKRKKEKKREKKERDKTRDSGEIVGKKHGHKKRHKDERSQEYQKEGDHRKRRENEVESFEKSTITEEHGHTVGPQNSSDSTLNSNIRQMQSSPPDSWHNPGSIIRIRLPSRRQKDSEVLPSKEWTCSTSGRINDAFVQGMHEHAPRSGREPEERPCSTSCIRGPELTFKFSKEKPCSSSVASEILARNAEVLLPSNLHSSCSPIFALEFKNLVEDWVVPTLHSELTCLADEDWLIQGKENYNSRVESSKDGTGGLSQINLTSWPQACYLREADIYALPFTVPL